MWNEETRGRYDRRGLRYPSDLTDAEWALIAPMIPPAKRGGRRREVNVREVLNGLLYVLETGCPWRHLPKDFPPKSTVHGYFDLWAWDGTLERMHEALYLAFQPLNPFHCSLISIRLLVPFSCFMAVSILSPIVSLMPIRVPSPFSRLWAITFFFTRPVLFSLSALISLAMGSFTHLLS